MKKIKNNINLGPQRLSSSDDLSQLRSTILLMTQRPATGHATVANFRSRAVLGFSSRIKHVTVRTNLKSFFQCLPYLLWLFVRLVYNWTVSSVTGPHLSSLKVCTSLKIISTVSSWSSSVTCRYFCVVFYLYPYLWFVIFGLVYVAISISGYAASMVGNG